MANPMVMMETPEGEVLIELYEDKAPKTVANFLQYVDEEFYAGTIFHRVINNFMIQGGGFDFSMKEKATHAPVENEADNGLKNEVGTLAMARTMDPHSASSQFFINVKDNGFLDHTAKNPQGWGYCVFGKVIDGMEAIDKIKKVRTRSHGPMDDVPVDPISIISMIRFED
ncbi:peptidylprolyl isomerase [Desulfovibrio gilichinskyi]|uniref:Peptidyl-prolyl cis-trans isomerase n=1 Tax=Desulfovibrio gilichinskyi TaxID=1519643 RepID=A0A1X7DGP2_9BACT|nr:peptidylprolyl isomerase [Desulfovibrio gilichinskyi]SMF15338.1 peptidyl-prolyl cis-trans isomerase B (cyclophilin B) [Desulfovibrio gilichinskyi]